MDEGNTGSLSFTTWLVQKNKNQPNKSDCYGKMLPDTSNAAIMQMPQYDHQSAVEKGKRKNEGEGLMYTILQHKKAKTPAKLVSTLSTKIKKWGYSLM